MALECGFYGLAKRIVDDRNAVRRQPGAVLLARSIEALRIDKHKRRALVRWFIEKEVRDRLHAQSLDRQKHDQLLLKKVAVHIGRDGVHTRRRSNAHRKSRISMGDSNSSNPITPGNRTPASGSPSRRGSNSLALPVADVSLPAISTFVKRGSPSQGPYLLVQTNELQAPRSEMNMIPRAATADSEVNSTPLLSAPIVIPVPIPPGSKQTGKQVFPSPQKGKNFKTDAPTETHEDNSDQSMTLTNTLRQEVSHPRFLTLNSQRKIGQRGHFLNTSPGKHGKNHSSELELPSVRKGLYGSTLGEESTLGIEIRNYDHPDFYPKPKVLDFLDPHMRKRVDRVIDQESQRNNQPTPVVFER